MRWFHWIPAEDGERDVLVTPVGDSGTAKEQEEQEELVDREV